ncbi:Methanogenesis regulatory histidine kinase FilI [Candidatus Burarchaeum australiense]|nr:Methanogenesis regulatory histidine kinase FilI [Candidatus Burarchaeum australiense]
MNATGEALPGFMAAMGANKSLAELLRSLPAALAALTLPAKFDEAALAFLPEGREESFEAKALFGKGCWSGKMPFAGSAVQAAVEKRAPLTEAGIGKYSNYFDVRKLAEAGLLSYAIFPLSCEGRIFATLNFASANENAFSEASLRLLESAGDYLAKSTYALMSSERARQRSTSEAIAQLLPHIYFSLDSDFRLSPADGAPLSLLGYTSAELAGLRISNIVHSDDYARLDTVLQDLSAGATVKDVDFTFIAKDSSHRRFELRGRKNGPRIECLLLPSGPADGDKGSRMVADFAALSSDAIYTMDVFGVVRSWSPGAQRIFGYTEADIVGTEARRLFPNSSTRELDEMMARLKSGNSKAAPPTPQSMMTARVGKDNKPVAVLSSAIALTDDDGKVTGYLEVLRDMRPAVLLDAKERELREQVRKNRELANDIGEKDKFISDVSHELRTPLTNIRGYASLLRDGEAGGLTQQQREFTEIICGQTDRLSQLITDVLDLSKMESNKFRLEMRLFDPRTLEETCSCESMAQEKDLYVKWNFGDGVDDVYGDPAKLAQVLINLISNAIKFTGSGGVTVNVKNLSRTFVQFDVSDTGAGIPADEKPKLFKRFSQLSAGADRKGGTGLGLAITKELVRLHGGKIWLASSEPGKGSTFSFKVRRTPPPKRGKKEE